MGHLVNVAMEFIDRCERHQQLGGLINDFSKTVCCFGFSAFMMTRLPALNEDAEPYVIAHSWPVEWLNRYREQAYFWHDPVSLHSFTQVRPFSWIEARRSYPGTRLAMQLASEASSLGLVDGIGFPMGDPNCVQAVVSLASDMPVDLDTMSREMLHLVCIHAEIRAVELHEHAPAMFGRLSRREREVLRWIANGKTMADVGDILSISQRTVRDHVEHAKLRLNASTATHAVAKAIKSRQIIL